MPRGDKSPCYQCEADGRSGLRYGQVSGAYPHGPSESGTDDSPGAKIKKLNLKAT